MCLAGTRKAGDELYGEVFGCSERCQKQHRHRIVPLHNEVMVDSPMMPRSFRSQPATAWSALLIFCKHDKRVEVGSEGLQLAQDWTGTVVAKSEKIVNGFDLSGSSSRGQVGVLGYPARPGTLLPLSSKSTTASSQAASCESRQVPGFLSTHRIAQGRCFTPAFDDK